MINIPMKLNLQSTSESIEGHLPLRGGSLKFADKLDNIIKVYRTQNDILRIATMPYMVIEVPLTEDQLNNGFETTLIFDNNV